MIGPVINRIGPCLDEAEDEEEDRWGLAPHGS